jgi:hypothetical protein
MPDLGQGVTSKPFLAYVTCAGCGEPFPVTKRLALNRAKWCSERCRKRQYRKPCASCGNLCGGADKSTYCADCGSRIAGEMAADRARIYRETIEAMWAEGMTMREINDAVGHTKINFSTARARGWNLPHRHRVGDLTLRLANLAEARAKATEQ